MLDSTLPNTAHPGASPRTKAFASLMHSSIGWSCVSDVTGRRFGKTISVSMFAAAMIYATPNVECSIYSTCKRISQKLLRNVVKFLNLIYTGLNVPKYRIIRENMEELVVHGPESAQDVRIVNSYPSKVGGGNSGGYGGGGFCSCSSFSSSMCPRACCMDCCRRGECFNDTRLNTESIHAQADMYPVRSGTEL